MTGQATGSAPQGSQGLPASGVTTSAWETQGACSTRPCLLYTSDAADE